MYIIKLTISKGLGWDSSNIILEVYNIFGQPVLMEGVPAHGRGVGTR